MALKKNSLDPRPNVFGALFGGFLFGQNAKVIAKKNWSNLTFFYSWIPFKELLNWAKCPGGVWGMPKSLENFFRISTTLGFPKYGHCDSMNESAQLGRFSANGFPYQSDMLSNPEPSTIPPILM